MSLAQSNVRFIGCTFLLGVAALALAMSLLWQKQREARLEDGGRRAALASVSTEPATEASLLVEAGEIPLLNSGKARPSTASSLPEPLRFEAGSSPEMTKPERFDYLPAEKREEVARVVSSYAGLIRHAERLASELESEEGERLRRQLRQQREAALAAFLSPREKFEYDLHEGDAAFRTRRLPMDFTPQEFEAIVWIEQWREAQWEAEESHGGGDRREVHLAWERALRETLGERFEEYERVSDPYWEACVQFTREQGLDESLALWLHLCRARYAETTAAIERAALSPEDRDQQLAALQDRFAAGIRPYLGQGYASGLTTALYWLNRL